MLTQEERKESRTICKAATPGPWKIIGSHKLPFIRSEITSFAVAAIIEGGFNDAVFIAHARTALPAALDALDEMEIKHECLSTTYDFLKAHAERTEVDRDRYKARCEALERAIDKDCSVCTKESCRLPCGCINYNGWQFDEARFERSEDGD